MYSSLHFLPVARWGTELLTGGSHNSANFISSLALVHLALLHQCQVNSLRHLGSPSHFLPYSPANWHVLQWSIEIVHITQGTRPNLETPPLQLPWEDSAVDLLETIDGILPKLFHLPTVFEVCCVPATEAFDKALQDQWYRLIINVDVRRGGRHS